MYKIVTIKTQCNENKLNNLAQANSTIILKKWTIIWSTASFIKCKFTNENVKAQLVVTYWFEKAVMSCHLWIHRTMRWNWGKFIQSNSNLAELSCFCSVQTGYNDAWMKEVVTALRPFAYCCLLVMWLALLLM